MDSITNLPDDIIHHILSFLDTKYAIQFCTLSQNWKNMWTLIPRLNINTKTFYSKHHIAKFVTHALNHRNNLTEVSTVNLTFTGPVDHFVVEDIVKYAYLHNVKQLTIEWVSGTLSALPQCLFSSHTLKHLNLGCEISCHVSVSSWDFPLLETLVLSAVRLGDGSDKNLNLFSKCVNLKDLTLHKCCMSGLESFSVCAPQLLNLTITKTTLFPTVFDVVAPQLENLTASVVTENGALFSSFNLLRLSTEGFSSLEKVNLYASKGRYKMEKLVPLLLDLFRIVRNAKHLILDVDIIKCLSSCLDQLSNEPCPFDNLKCLKINTTCLKQDDNIPTIPTQVRNFFLKNSPIARLVIDSHFLEVFLVTKKRTQNQLIAKLKTNLKMKDQVIANQKEDIQWKDQVIAKQNANIEMLKSNSIHIKSHVPALRPVAIPLAIPFSWNVQKTNFCMKNLQPTLTEENKMLEEKIQIQDQLIANLKTKLQKADIVIADQTISLQMKEKVIAEQKAQIKMLKSNNISKPKSYVRAPFLVSGASSRNVPRKRSTEQGITAQCLSWGKKKRFQTVGSKKIECWGTSIPLPIQQIANEKRKLQIKEQFVANPNANLQMKDQVIADQNTALQMKDQVIADQNADIKMKDQVIADRNADIEMKEKVIAKLIADIEMLKSDRIHMESSVPAPPPVPRPSSSNEEEGANDIMAEGREKDPRANHDAAKAKLEQDDATDDEPMLCATVPAPNDGIRTTLILKRKSDEMAKPAKRVRFNPTRKRS